MSGAAPDGLVELARRAGIAVGFHDLSGSWCEASTATLQALLAALGLPAGDERAVDESTRALDRSAWARLVEPTTVCWAGDTAGLTLRRPSASAGVPVEVTLELEGGGSFRQVLGADHLAESGAATVEGVPYVAQRALLSEALPVGGHRARVVSGDQCEDGIVLVAPRLAPAPGRGWGVFAPLHSLRRSGEDRVGDLEDLAALADWVADLGGGLVGTLPLLATFDGDASPYAPISRLAWNERHLHLAALPEWEGDGSPSDGSAAGVGGDLIDPVAEADRSRAALSLAARRLSDARRAELDRFTECHPHVDELARWRAAVELDGPPPPGRPLGDGEPSAVLRHRYGQWAMETQLGELRERLDRRGQALYLDLPLGVHGEGFDVWRSPELFASEVSVGAPPDGFFTAGQNWGFPPVLPDASRADGHAYLRGALAHQLRHAGMVRIDHVMALHRLWWVPAGADATDGAYVHYPAEELAAILTLEACRAGAVVVGENLGTVPPEVNELLEAHRFVGMYATQFELESAPHARRPPAGTLAVVNTHDMAPFAAFWDNADQGFRWRIMEQLGREGHAAAGEETLDVLEALLGWLGESEASTVVVTLEDLWAEHRPQNRPGTGPEVPNWRRRMTRTLEELRDDPAIAHRLQRLRASRPRGTPPC